MKDIYMIHLLNKQIKLTRDMMRDMQGVQMLGMAT